MASTVTVANIEISTVDPSGNFIDYVPLAKQLASLTIDGQYRTSTLYTFDASGNYTGQSIVITVFLIASNDATALADYNTFKAALPTGSSTNVWYTNQTLS